MSTKAKILLFVLTSLTLTVNCQTNKFLKFSEVNTDFKGNSIINIIVLDDSVKYHYTMNLMNYDHYDNFPFSYIDSIDLDFQMISTRFLKDDSIFWAVHFNLQNGIEFAFSADTFNIPPGAKFYLKTLNGNTIESYDYICNPNYYKGIKSYFFLERFQPIQNVVMILTIPQNNNSKKYKIHLNAIVITVADFKRRIKIND